MALGKSSILTEGEECSDMVGEFREWLLYVDDDDEVYDSPSIAAACTDDACGMKSRLWMLCCSGLQRKGQVSSRDAGAGMANVAFSLCTACRNQGRAR